MKRQATENIMFTCKNKVLFFMYVWVRHGCQSHNLLAGKLNAYGFETSAVRLIFDYLSNRKQQTKTDCQYSSQSRSRGCRKHPRWRA